MPTHKFSSDMSQRQGRVASTSSGIGHERSVMESNEAEEQGQMKPREAC